MRKRRAHAVAEQTARQIAEDSGADRHAAGVHRCARVGVAALFDEPGDGEHRRTRAVAEQRPSEQHEEELAARGERPPDISHQLANRRQGDRRRSLESGRAPSSLGLAKEAQGEDGEKPDAAEEKEAGAPTEAGRDDAADDQAARHAERHAGVVDAGGEPQPAARKGVAEHRERRRGERRFADADEDARQGELDEVPRQSRERGHRAPQRQAAGEQPQARPAVGGEPEEDPHQGVEEDEAEAGEEPDLGSRQAEVGDQQRSETRDQGAIDEVQDVEQSEIEQQRDGRPVDGALDPGLVSAEESGLVCEDAGLGMVEP